MHNHHYFLLLSNMWLTQSLNVYVLLTWGTYESQSISLSLTVFHCSSVLDQNSTDFSLLTLWLAVMQVRSRMMLKTVNWENQEYQVEVIAVVVVVWKPHFFNVSICCLCVFLVSLRVDKWSLRDDASISAAYTLPCSCNFVIGQGNPHSTTPYQNPLITRIRTQITHWSSNSSHTWLRFGEGAHHYSSSVLM